MIDQKMVQVHHYYSCYVGSSPTSITTRKRSTVRVCYKSPMGANTLENLIKCALYQISIELENYIIWKRKHERQNKPKLYNYSE